MVPLVTLRGPNLKPPRAAAAPMKVLITGATSGIGRACARRFAEAGAELVLMARRESMLDALADELKEQHGAKSTVLPVDVRDKTLLAGLQQTDPQVFAEVDVLVNNAGLARGLDTIQEGKVEDWDDMIDTNVKGLLYVTRMVLPGMVGRGKGHVVNIGSTAGHWVYKGGAVYCATKHAVAAITEALRLDVHGTGVRVSSVDPGHVETNFARVRFEDDERARKLYEGFTPLAPDDVADAVHWVTTRPAHVNIQDMILTPTDQSSVRDIHRRA